MTPRGAARGPSARGGAGGASRREPLPRAISLPSGVRVRLDEGAARRVKPGSSNPIGRALEILQAPGVLRGEDGAPVSLSALTRADGHVLRAFLARGGLVDEPDVVLLCDNCGNEHAFAPSSAFEPGPFVDGELDDDELDEAFDHEVAHPIPPIVTGRGAARTLRLAPRSADELGVLASAAGPVPLSRAVVAALGIVALGKERKAEAIARGLERADDEAWTAIAALYDRAHYPARLVGSRLCDCGARLVAPAPAPHELDAIAPSVGAEEVAEREGFPSLDEFERLARKAARRAFRKQGLTPIAVVCDVGVAACDDGGVPLLGSYTPPGTDPAGLFDRPAEIRLYVRTFRSEHALDEGFDVSAEIVETVEHEIEHHGHFLTGHDPMDEEERAVIARDEARRVGRAELGRRAARGLGADLLGFVRVTWPVFVLFALLAAGRSCS